MQYDNSVELAGKYISSDVSPEERVGWIWLEVEQNTEVRVEMDIERYSDMIIHIRPGDNLRVEGEIMFTALSPLFDGVCVVPRSIRRIPVNELGQLFIPEGLEVYQT